jgi:hypothetical protein
MYRERDPRQPGLSDALALSPESFWVGNHPLNHCGKALRIAVEALVPYIERVTAGEIGDALGQILPVRHYSVLNQDRNDPHVPGESSLDFQPHDVVRVVKTPTAPPVRCGQPVRTDDHQQYLAGRHRAVDGLGEVSARLDLVHVDEDPARSETLSEAIVQSAGGMATILSPITKKAPPAFSAGDDQLSLVAGRPPPRRLVGCDNLLTTAQLMAIADSTTGG